MSEFNFISKIVDHEGIATLTLDNPERLNAMSRVMAGELIRALDAVDTDPTVRVVMLTGAGRAFCAGANLESGPEIFLPQQEATSASSRRDWGGELALRIFSLNKPVIAVLNGAAVGLGATLTLPCDVRIASSSAKFGFVFTRRGIVTDGCASWFLPRIVGVGTALQWCLSGELFSAQDALSAGLVQYVYEPDELLDGANTLARDIAANTSAVSVALTRRLLWHGLVASHPMESHRLESVLMDFTGSGADVKEGVDSFMKKRSAKFISRVPNDLPPDWPLWSEPSFEEGSF